MVEFRLRVVLLSSWIPKLGIGLEVDLVGHALHRIRIGNWSQILTGLNLSWMKIHHRRLSQLASWAFIGSVLKLSFGEWLVHCWVRSFGNDKKRMINFDKMP